MKFEISEKLAIVNLVDSVIMADGEVHKGEINAFSDLMEVIDFDSNFLDTNRWGTANWTFEQNASTFRTSNVSVEDGKLILRLTE